MHFLVGLAGVAIWKYMSACFITHVACSHQHCRRKSRERTFTGQGTAGLTRDHLQRDTRKDMTAVLRTVNEINSAQPVDVLHISSFTISSINSMTYHDIWTFIICTFYIILSIMNVSQIFLQTNVGSGREGFFNVSLQVSRWSKVWSKHWKSPRSGLLRRFAELFETMSWLSEGFHYDYNYVCDLYTLFFLFMLHFWIETCRFSFGICFSWCGETSGLFGDWTDRIHLGTPPLPFVLSYRSQLRHKTRLVECDRRSHRRLQKKISSHLLRLRPPGAWLIHYHESYQYIM